MFSKVFFKVLKTGTNQNERKKQAEDPENLRIFMVFILVLDKLISANALKFFV